MRSLLSAAIVYLVLLAPGAAYAHLGEEHPQGQHDYFPEIPTTQVPLDVEQLPFTTGSWWPDAQFVPGDPERMLLANRFQEVFHVTEEGRNTYLTAGENHGWAFEGLGALEFHPDFANEGTPGFAKFYTLTTDLDFSIPADFQSGTKVTHHNVLTEWTASDISSNSFAGSSRELMRFSESSKFHNVNDLAFGPDKMLYVALGEDEQDPQASDVSKVFGKILRIDPMGDNSTNGAYGIPNDNPFVNDANAAPEVYAYGLRNPWRMTFDSATGDLWVMDVGWRSIEEVNRVTAGGHYGWPHKEGTMLAAGEATQDLPDPETGLTLAESQGYIDPMFEYDHTDGVTVIGGLVYRGDKIPWLKGKVVFADLGSAFTPAPRLFYGDPETGEMVHILGHERLDPYWGQCRLGEELASCPIYSVNEDPDGEILILGKSVLRVVPLPADFNGNGTLDVNDVDLLSKEIRDGTANLGFDVDQDGDLDHDDLSAWVINRRNTYFGDANLDGEFNSGDLVAIFQRGRYETGEEAGWAQGDWDADGLFTLSDLVTAFQNGGYEQGPRDVVPEPVPEPNTGLMLSLAFAFLPALRRRQESNSL